MERFVRGLGPVINEPLSSEIQHFSDIFGEAVRTRNALDAEIAKVTGHSPIDHPALFSTTRGLLQDQHCAHIHDYYFKKAIAREEFEYNAAIKKLYEYIR